MKLAMVNPINTILATTLLVVATGTTASAEIVSVRLADGKQLHGHVDPRTDDERLWLRFGGGSTIILRPLAWEQVEEVWQDGRNVDPDKVRDLATAVSTQPQRPSPRTPVEGPSSAERARTLLGFGRRVSSVDFDAHLANWDGDVEFDGIALRVFPLDADGNPTHARGTVEVELVANRKQRFIEAPSSGGRTVEQVARWSTAIHTQDPADGVLVKLPFQATHPEFDTRWATHGLLHVRLVVPGHGVFEHSFDGIRIRPYAPLRDSLERQGNQRFLPSEQTGIGRRSQ